jgi:hypothetical protein
MSTFRFAVCPIVIAGVAAVAACRHKQPPAPPVATPSVTLSQTRAPLGAPIEITYKFVVASDGHFDENYRVMAHVVDSDEEMMWTDDHNPPTPTKEWKPGQTIEYTRTVFVPVYPYVGEATIQLGLYSTVSQKRLPLNGEDMGQRAYKVARLQLLPQSENVYTVFKDGWHPTEVAEHNASVEWQWTKKEATLAFKNPRKDSVFYLEADNPGGVFLENQQVQVMIGSHMVDQFTISPKQQVLRKIPLSASQLGATDMVELQIEVDKTFVPALVPASNSKDPRELGIRVFHAFIQPRT